MLFSQHLNWNLDMFKKRWLSVTLQKFEKSQIFVLFENEASYEEFFLPTSVLSHVTNTLCYIFGQNLIKKAQGYKSSIFLLLHQYTFIAVFFRKSIIEIWEINPWRRNSSINSSRELAFTEIAGNFRNIETKIRNCIMKSD